MSSYTQVPPSHRDLHHDEAAMNGARLHTDSHHEAYRDQAPTHHQPTPGLSYQEFRAAPEAKDAMNQETSSHNLSPMDPDSPMAWPLWKKLYTSFVSWSFSFTILYGTTTYSTAIPTIMAALNASQHIVNLGFTLPFFGVFFAPIYAPHMTERWGRRPIYFASFGLFSLCVVVIGLADSIPVLLVFRFLAGLFGGPCLVLLEGTFADIWSAETTNTYYSFLTIAQYWGAALGPVIGGIVLPRKGLPWLSWVTLLFATFAIGFGGAMPETYGREILRKRNRYARRNTTLPAALSGVTLGQMLTHTVVNPLKMLAFEPLAGFISLHVGLNFAVVFQWFISVPAALGSVYGFSVADTGLAFIGAICGSLLSLICCAGIEAVTGGTRGGHNIEKRLLPAILGAVLIAGSLFWVGHTVDPMVNHLAPIFGTAVYVWGSAMVQIGYIAYVFDAYPPAGTLSALTAAACFRLLCAGIVPIFILDMIMALEPKWAFGVFGIIAAVMVLIPIGLFFFGSRLRAGSRYADKGAMNSAEMEEAARERGHPLMSGHSQA